MNNNSSDWNITNEKDNIVNAADDSVKDMQQRGVSLQSPTLHCPFEKRRSPEAIINRRRYAEAAHHMLAAG